ncbi:hypothetical protein ABZZ80_20265 [Streptomyces sp. NPDC006356]
MMRGAYALGVLVTVWRAEPLVAGAGWNTPATVLPGATEGAIVPEGLRQTRFDGS